MKLEELYITGEYLEKNPTWHVEESPWKVKHILPLMFRNGIAPQTICEAGSGAGEVLRLLQERMDSECEFWGYDISPQAFELSRSRANEKLHFRLADLTKENGVHYDLILILDVLEHLEDYFSFLRSLKEKSEYKIIHVPLDLTLQKLLRPRGLLQVREEYGHIHYFTKSTFLEMLNEVGYEVVEWFYAPRSIGLANNIIKKLLIPPRVLFYALRKDLAVRVLGGYSLMVLAK